MITKRDERVFLLGVACGVALWIWTSFATPYVSKFLDWLFPQSAPGVPC